MKALPNILTGIRLLLSVLVFVILVAMRNALPGVTVDGHTSNALLVLAFAAFVIAAITDFFDGWLARRYDAVSVAGAILDPIADKILVCGAILGLAIFSPDVALPGGLILFREFSVSAMREVLAPRGIKLPVTFLAKTKTTLQLLALGCILGMPLLNVALIGAYDDLPRLALVHNLMLASLGLLWLAAAVTVWTGIEYAVAARKALKAQD